MAQITHLMQAKAAFDAACLDMEWAYRFYDPGLPKEYRGPAAAVNRIQDVLKEAEKRCIRVLLEEEETPAMMTIQEQEVESRSIGDWLTSVKDVAHHMRAYARERLMEDGIKDYDDEPQHEHGCNKLIARTMLPCLAPKIKTTTSLAILEKLEALMAEYEGFRCTKGLPLASCCMEHPLCVGQQSIITDVPLGRERDDDKQRIIGIITQQAAESRETETDQPQLPLGLHTLAVLSHLKLRHLPQWLCFATCAFCFSKGRSISRYDLEWQWTTLSSSSTYSDAWDLLGCSLLRENSASNASAVLKDVMLVSTDDKMYDLARYVLGDRLIVVDGRNGGATVLPDVKRSSNAYLAVISNWDANQRLDLSSILPAGILALRFEDCPAKMELSDGAFVFSSAEHLLVLDLSGCSLRKLPESIGQLKRLRYLNAPGIQDRVLPVCLIRLHGLRYLSLRESPLLTDLTEEFGRLSCLHHLDLSGCSGLKALPDSFGRGLYSGEFWQHGLRVRGLSHLDLSGCSCVGGITEVLQRFKDLRYLNLSHRCGYSSVEDWFHLKDLDKVLPQHKELRFLGLSSCLNPLCYTSTPDKSKDYVDRCIRDLVRLQHLDLSQNKFLVQLPESMGNLRELRSLDLSGCFRLKSLPESIGGLKGMCTLSLSGCFRLERLPERIGELETLETLDLSGCPQFDPLPENVEPKLAKLRYQGSLTIITDGKVYHLCQAGAHEDQSQERSIVAGDDQAQGSASKPQDASFVDPSSAAEPEIIEATDPDQ